VRSFTHDPSGRVVGAVVEADGGSIDVRARVVVNACGVWSDRVRAFDRDAAPALLRPAKGIHITVPRSLVRNEIAAVLPVPDDKRTVFVVPWGDFTYVGTTDTDYEGDIDDPRCSDDDVAYLLRTINASLASPIARDDIVGAWAGLRPLVAATHNSRGRTSDLSRRHLVHVANSGLITVTGGKLTTYRRMAEDTIDHARRLLGLHGHRCLTSRVPLVGADGFGGAALTGHLAERFGSEADLVLRIAEDTELARPLIDGLPYLRAEVVFAARYEMAQTVDDVLSRRTRARLLARRESIAAADDVAALLGDELGLSPAARRQQVDAYRSRVTDAE
jgi:glycerol-3-phosphate dehydrogenase